MYKVWSPAPQQKAGTLLRYLSYLGIPLRYTGVFGIGTTCMRYVWSILISRIMFAGIENRLFRLAPRQYCEFGFLPGCSFSESHGHELAAIIINISIIL